MKIVMIIVILFLAYFSFGLLIFLTSESFDEAMDFIREGNEDSPENQWISIIYTVLRNTPYNTCNRIKRFIKKLFK